MMTRRDADLAGLGREPYVASLRRVANPPALRKAKQSPKARSRHIRDRHATFPGFIRALANLVHHERLPTSGPSAEHVRALGHHQVELARLMRALRATATRPASPLVLGPFLLAGIYLARMLNELAKGEHRPSHAFTKALFDGEDALEKVGTEAFAREILPNPKDQDAWIENCGNAAVWLQRLALAPYDSVALVRRCERATCAAPFYLYRRGPLESRFCKVCGGSGRTAAHRTRRKVRPPAAPTARPPRALVR
jgi:hypothetical protein